MGRDHHPGSCVRRSPGRFILVSLVVLLVGSGCAGIRPYPRYTVNHPRVHLQKAVTAFLGTPYKWGGEDRDGIDCSGLVVAIFQKALDLSFPHSTAELYRTGRPVGSGRIRYGDLVFFAEDGVRPTHVGIYLEGNQFVHASSERGVIVSSLKTDYFRERFIGARRISQ